MASTAASVGTTTVTAIATSGSITHSATFSLTVTKAAAFQIHVSPSSLSLTPGAVVTVQVSVTTSDGSSPQLGVTVSGPPNLDQIGVSSPQGFLTPTNPVSFIVNPTLLAQPVQNFPLVVTAGDNSANPMNSSVFVVSLTVTIPFASNATPTRSTFVRTDQSPTGMVYDRARKLLFVSVEVLNEVLVLSTADGHRVATIPVNFPAGIDETQDGSAVYVVSPFFAGVTTIDPNSLEVIGHSQPPNAPSSPNQVITFFQVAALSNGKVLLAPTFDVISTTTQYYLWDPRANTFTPIGLSSLGPQAGLISRSADGSKVLVETSNGDAVYDTATNTFADPGSAASATSAISPDGSHIVTLVGLSAGNVAAVLLDSSFSVQANLPLGNFGFPTLTYSLDGRRVYIIGSQGNPSAVIDAKTFTILGLIPPMAFNASIPFSGQVISAFATDESGMLFGPVSLGVGFLDMTSPTSLSEPLPIPFQVMPPLANQSSVTTAQFNAAVGITSNFTTNLFFGPPPASPQAVKATGISPQSTGFVDFSIPASTLTGPANATLTRSDGFFEVVPDAVTFGPTILSTDTEGASPSGGDTVRIVGYGVAEQGIAVTIGGKAATVVSNMGPTGDAILPTASVTVKTPPGTPGSVDLTVSSSAGTFTATNAFQYLDSVQVFPTVGALDALTYDQTRKRLYISNQDHNRVEIFDLGTNKFLTPISVGNAPTSLTVTPDAALLAVVNSADGTTSVIDLSKSSVMATLPVLSAVDSDKQACGGLVTTITPGVTSAAPHGVVVGINCTSLELQGNAHFVNLDSGSLSCSGIAGCSTNGVDLPSMAGATLVSSADATKVFSPNGIVLLDLTANAISTASGSMFSDAAASADGTTFAADFGTYDSRPARLSIMAFEPYADSGSQSFHNVAGEKLSPSGSLLFYPQDSGVDIFDVHTGRLVRHVVLPDPLPLDTNTLVLDETGSKMFLISNTGITIAQLHEVPLSLARAVPSSGTPGSTVTLRGSGFQSGITVKFANTSVQSSVVDANTLTATVPSLAAGPVRITLANPNGASYSLDAAFVIQ